MLLRLIPQLLDYMYTARTAAAAFEPTPGLDALKTKARTASDWRVVLEFCDKQVELLLLLNSLVLCIFKF